MEYLLIDLDDPSEYRSVQKFTDNAVNPCVQSTYTFIEHVMEEVIQMHADIQPLQVYNFGGDEVPGGAWLESPICQDMFGEEIDRDEVKIYFVTRVGELAHAHGLDLSGWEDTLMIDRNTPYNRSLFESENVYGYFWNNIWEGGAAKRAYVMANADYKVTHVGLTASDDTGMRGQ